MYVFDLDGTITKNAGRVSHMKVPWWLIWLALAIYRPPVKREVVRLMEHVKGEGEKVVIITARPPQLEGLTKRYLHKKGVPFDDIIFVGTGPHSCKRKIEASLKIKAKYVCDNNTRVLREAKKKGLEIIVP